MLLPLLLAVSTLDLSGSWLSEVYAEALLATRSPLAAAARSEPLGLEVTPDRLSVTSFHEGFWRVLRAVEPGAASGEVVLVLGEQAEVAEPAAWRRVNARLGPGEPPRLSAALWSDDVVIYRRLPGTLKGFVNHGLLAGKYRDQRGRVYSFSEDGEATWPERSFPYQVSLDVSEAACDYLQTPDPTQPGGQRRYGFAWVDGKLQLHHVVYDLPVPISCQAAPFAVLEPVR
jgi:hypothetical protein